MILLGRRDYTLPEIQHYREVQFGSKRCNLVAAQRRSLAMIWSHGVGCIGGVREGSLMVSFCEMCLGELYIFYCLLVLVNVRNDLGVSVDSLLSELLISR